jgi:KaiC/GvpD/RAD55 family RecA-like ATPase
LSWRLQRFEHSSNSAGIGKSLFRYLLLYRWAREGRRVVVVKENVYHSKAMLLTAEGAFEVE